MKIKSEIPELTDKEFKHARRLTLRERKRFHKAVKEKQVDFEALLKKARKEVKSRPKFVRDAAKIVLSKEGYS